MPARIRSLVLDRAEVGIYHCYARCVRRAFLCGVDPVSGLDCSHRRGWIRSRLEALASIFAIDVLGHGILDNHYHTVLRNHPSLPTTWSDEEVCKRWMRLSRHRLELKDPPRKKQLEKLLKDAKSIAEWRARLSDISWFMLMLNEPIARIANEEDKKSGHFLAERFGCVRLQTDESILACSLYVDLNLIRANIAETPEDSTFTGACDRILDWMSETIARGEKPSVRIRELLGLSNDTDEFDDKMLTAKLRSGWMSPIREEGDGYSGVAAGRRASDTGFLPISQQHYFELLDELGRKAAPGKKGVIPETLPPILERLGFDTERWEEAAKSTQRRFAYLDQLASNQRAERALNDEKSPERPQGAALGAKVVSLETDVHDSENQNAVTHSNDDRRRHTTRSDRRHRPRHEDHDLREDELR
ncbi:MAG: hypothetical protein U0939_06680 [Pirellulales bacterium]